MGEHSDLYPSHLTDPVETLDLKANGSSTVEQIECRTNMKTAPEQIGVQSQPVFKARDRTVFALMTLLNGLAVLTAFAIWLTYPAWIQAPLVFVGLTLVLAGTVAIQQARWFLLPLMKRPIPLKIRQQWKVAVATTFVPGSEPLDMLEATVKSLVALDYPHDTWVLDEGNSDRVKDVCRKHGARHFSRKDYAEYQGETGAYRSGTKYGNYNSWLSEIGFAEYDILTAFDPDHIPRPSFLTSVLGYFEDPRIAYVQVAQAYGNQDESWIARGAAEETYDYFSTIQMASYGASFPIIVGGHNSHRINALQKIGGFGAHDADDILTTLLYRDAGWQGVYVPGILARGRTPSDWHTYLSQQRRWARSVLDIKLRTYPGLSAKTPRATRILSVIHGFNYLAQGLLPALALALLCLICGTAINSQHIVFHLTVPLVILIASYWLSEVYRQRFYLDPEHESGIHWRARVLRWARWPQMLLALVDVIIDRRPTYRITPKVKGVVFRPRLLLPHFLVVAVLVCCWVVGVRTGAATPLSHIIAASVIAATFALAATVRLSARRRTLTERGRTGDFATGKG